MPEPGSGRKIFYGWWVVVVAFFANFMATGSGFYAFNAFVKPLCDTRSWSRTEVNAAPAIALVAGLFASLLYGTLVTRIGPRVLMVFGSVLSGTAFIFLGHSGSLSLFYLFFVFLVLGNGAMNGIISNTAVSNWFILRRGSALGLATAGISLSGAVLPLAAMFLLDRFGLSAAFLAIGLVIMLVAPAALLVVRHRPEDHGLLPDGVSPDEQMTLARELLESRDAAGSAPAASYWTPGRLFRTAAFWKSGLAYGLALMGVAGVMFQLAPRFTDIGFGRSEAMAMMAATALVGTVGKYVWGMLCDRFDSRRVAGLMMAANAAGLALALVPNSIPALVLFILCFGFAMGGVMSTLPVIIADLFGRDSFAQAARFIAVLIIIQAGGYIIMGRSFDLTGSYNTAYAIFILLDLIAALLVFSIRRPRLEQGAGTRG